MTSRHFQLWCPALSNKREEMGAYHDNVTTRQNFVGAHVLATIDLKFIDFKVISILQSEKVSVSIKALWYHYDDVIMTMLASQITSLTVVYSIVYSGVNQRKHQSSASLAFVREIHRGPVNFPHKWPVTRKMFPFDDVIMTNISASVQLW